MPLHPRLHALGFAIEGRTLKASGVTIQGVRLIDGGRALIVLGPGDAIPVEGVDAIRLLRATVGSAFAEEVFQSREAVPPPPTTSPAPSIAGIRPSARPSVFARSSGRPHVFSSSPARQGPPAPPPAPPLIHVPPTSVEAFERVLRPRGFTMEGQVLKVPTLDNVEISFRDDGVEIVLPEGEKFWIPGARLEAGEMSVGAPGKVGLTLE